MVESNSIVVRALGGWNQIRGLLVTTLVVLLVSIAISGYQFQSDASGFVTNAQTFAGDWSKGCQSEPYKYFAPFSFTVSIGGITSEGYCGYPVANTAFRLTMASLSILVLPVLFVQTAVSYFAAALLLTLALFWFCIFVLDCNAYELGNSTCEGQFAGTTLAFSSNYDCGNGTVYLATIFIDLMIFYLLFTTWYVWDACPNLYNAESRGHSTTATVIKALFNSWMRLRIWLFTIVFVACTSIVISGIQYQSNPGETIINISDSNWASDCSSTYGYIIPFSFQGQDKNGDLTGNPAYCGWPESTTIYRLVIAGFSLILAILFFFKTAVSRFASAMFFIFMWAWLASLILDANNYTLGNESCENNFSGTPLNAALNAKNYDAYCNPGHVYLTSIFIDFALFIQFFALWLTWDYCDNLYGETNTASAGTSTGKNPLSGQ